eukprot:scaffold1149_cov380-Prasinococcus_capsulatus_cf.AAC.6
MSTDSWLPSVTSGWCRSARRRYARFTARSSAASLSVMPRTLSAPVRLIGIRSPFELQLTVRGRPRPPLLHFVLVLLVQPPLARYVPLLLGWRSRLWPRSLVSVRVAPFILRPGASEGPCGTRAARPWRVPVLTSRQGGRTLGVRRQFQLNSAAFCRPRRQPASLTYTPRPRTGARRWHCGAARRGGHCDAAAAAMPTAHCCDVAAVLGRSPRRLAGVALPRAERRSERGPKSARRHLRPPLNPKLSILTRVRKLALIRSFSRLPPDSRPPARRDDLARREGEGEYEP